MENMFKILHSAVYFTKKETIRLTTNTSLSDYHVVEGRSDRIKEGVN